MGACGFQTDIDILQHGVDQCVGDTLAPGGIMYAQRTIPVLLEFCKDISEVAAPGCLFINHSNPMAMNTWACSKYGYGVRFVGLCHGVEGGHWQIAQALGLPVNEVDIVCAGINHQTWYISVKHKGQDMTPKLLEAFERHPEFSKTEKVRIDMMRRFGYYSTESNGHLSEYVPWYRKRLEEIPQWIDLGSWINGETGGYLRVCVEGATGSSTTSRTDGRAAAPDRPGAPRPRARLVHHRGAGDRPSLPWTLQRGEPRQYHQPAARLHRRGAWLRGHPRLQHPCHWRPAAGSGRRVQRQRQRAAPGRRGGRAWRRLPAAPGDDDGSAHRGGLQPTGDLADGGRPADRPGAVAAQCADAIAAAKQRRATGKRLRRAKAKGAARLHTKSVAEMEADREAARKLAAEADKAKERPAAQ